MRIFLAHALLLLSLVVSTTQAFLSEDDLITLHGHFMTDEQLANFKRKLRGRRDSTGPNLVGETNHQQENWLDFMNRQLRRWRWSKGDGGGGGGGGWGGGKGSGGGGGGRGGGGGGGMTSEMQDTIRALARAGKDGKIERDVDYEVRNGVTAVTCSADPNVGALIQKHVADMTSLPEKARVRQGEPLFVAYFDHIEDMTLDYDEYQDNDCFGVEVTHTANDQCAIDLIKAHAKKVEKFAKGNMKVEDSPLPQSCN